MLVSVQPQAPELSSSGNLAAIYVVDMYWGAQHGASGADVFHYYCTSSTSVSSIVLPQPLNDDDGVVMVASLI